ncbi:MAG: hypothetical protein ACTHJ2_09310 [Candidatus Nitrosocosmicus sp.]
MDLLFINNREDEAFYVLGEYSFPYGDKILKAADKGQFINAPRGQFHTYRNIGKSVGKLLLIITLSHFEKF